MSPLRLDQLPAHVVEQLEKDGKLDAEGGRAAPRSTTPSGPPAIYHCHTCGFEVSWRGQATPAAALRHREERGPRHGWWELDLPSSA